MELDEETQKDLDAFMSFGRTLVQRHPELNDAMFDVLYPLFATFYFPRGIDPSGNPIKRRNDGCC